MRTILFLILLSVFVSCGDDSKCDGVKCGTNAVCESKTGECVCKDGFNGNPKEECIQLTCNDLICGANAFCNQTKVECQCNEGYEGNPKMGCTLAGLCGDYTCGTNASCDQNTLLCKCNEGFHGNPLTECVPEGQCLQDSAQRCLCEGNIYGLQACFEGEWQECFCDEESTYSGVGAQCSENAHCTGNGAKCYNNTEYMPDGYCTSECSSTGASCLDNGTCVVSGTDSFCYKNCEYGNDESCREYYVCENIANYALCVPACTSDLDCNATSGEFKFSCDTTTGHCNPLPGERKVWESCGSEIGNCVAEATCIKENLIDPEGICMLNCDPFLAVDLCDQVCDPDEPDAYCCDVNDPENKFCGTKCLSVGETGGVCGKPKGTIPIGGSCAENIYSCVAEATCVDGICLQNCNIEDENPCPETYRCVTLLEGNTVCMGNLPPECTLVTNEGCEANKICWPTGNGNLCFDAGSTQADALCEQESGTFACVSTHYCVSIEGESKCRKLCDDNLDCTGFCLNFANQEFGICID